MPVCNRCHKDWPEQYWVCPEDGTVLSTARAATAGGQLTPTPIGIPREEDLRPGTMIGEYRVEGKLGEGGMATVFAALQPLIGKRVAIKVISRRLCADVHAVDRFIGEARTVNQIGHPNLVDIFAFGVLPDGRAYLVMEWLQGETLADRLARGRLPAPAAFDLLHQIVEALEAAHEKGVVHRDLKPANIFLVERPPMRTKKDDTPPIIAPLRVKLLDFGIAKLADSDASVPKTRSGVAMGTAGYMSPEQARGKNVDHRTDIYALGCVAYEVMLGRIPFVADTAIDILAMHLASAPPSPRQFWPDVPAGLERVMMQMLAKEPDGRPSLQQVRAVLEASRRAITPTMGVPRGPRPRPPRRLATWLAAGAAVAMSGTGGWLMTRRAREAGGAATPPPPTLPSTAAPTIKPAPPRPIALTGAPSSSAVAGAEAAPAPAPKPGSSHATLVLHLPSGAHVRIDGQTQPAHNTTLLRIDVAGGEHRVVVTAPGHLKIDQRVRVAPGTIADVNALPIAKQDARAGVPAAPSKSPEAPMPSRSIDPQAQPPEGSSPRPTETKPSDPVKRGDYTLDPFK
jgi:serine/threonine-protein kinase